MLLPASSVHPQPLFIVVFVPINLHILALSVLVQHSIQGVHVLSQPQLLVLTSLTQPRIAISRSLTIRQEVSRSLSVGAVF